MSVFVYLAVVLHRVVVYFHCSSRFLGILSTLAFEWDSTCEGVTAIVQIIRFFLVRFLFFPSFDC